MKIYFSQRKRRKNIPLACRARPWYTPTGRRKDNSSPRYVLTIIGRLINRQLQRNPIVSKGVRLVKQISSGSLLNWVCQGSQSECCSETNNITRDAQKVRGDSIRPNLPVQTKIKRKKVMTMKKILNPSARNDAHSMEARIFQDQPTDQAEKLCSSVGGDISKKLANVCGTTRKRRTRLTKKMSGLHTELSFTALVNMNKNARVAEDGASKTTEESADKSLKIKQKKGMKTAKRRKPIRHSGLVVRSIGRRTRSAEYVKELHTELSFTALVNMNRNARVTEDDASKTKESADKSLKMKHKIVKKGMKTAKRRKPIRHCGLVPRSIGRMKESHMAPSFTALVNMNRNARVAEDNESKTEESADKVLKMKRKKGVKTAKRRKPVRHSGLVARSIGRPKISQHPRALTKKFGLLDKMKRIKRLRVARKKRNLKQDTHLLEGQESPIPDRSTTHSGDEQVSNRTTNKSRKQKLDFEKQPAETSEMTSAKQTRARRPLINSDNKCPIEIFHSERRNRSLLNQRESYNAQRRRISNKRNDKCKGDQPKRNRSKSSVSLRVCTRNGSSDSVNWPSLPVPSRIKARTKEAATAIVTSKICGSVNKMTKRRWADIVAQRSPASIKNSFERLKTENILDHQKKRNCSKERAKKTWASVAANAQSEKTRLTATCSKNTDQRNEVSKIPLSQNMMSKRRRKNKTRQKAAPFPLVEPQISNKMPLSLCKQFSDGNMGTLQKKRILRSKKSDAVVVENTLKLGSESKSCHQDVGPRNAENDRTKRIEIADSGSSLDENEWRMDNMKIVYTKPVGSVICLKESCQSTSKSIKDVNECNNFKKTTKMGTSLCKQGKNRDPANSISGDSVCSGSLCSRLSLISFKSKAKRGDITNSRKRLVPSAKDTAVSAVVTTEPTKDEETSNTTKQRKISKRYRALLRKDLNHVDLKTSSDIQTRTKRAEQLQNDKVAIRNMQRQQRQTRQSNAHSAHRTPTGLPNVARSMKPAIPAKNVPDKETANHGDDNEPGPSKAIDRKRSHKSSSNVETVDWEQTLKNSGGNNSRGWNETVNFNRFLSLRGSTITDDMTSDVRGEKPIRKSKSL